MNCVECLYLRWSDIEVRVWLREGADQLAHGGGQPWMCWVVVCSAQQNVKRMTVWSQPVIAVYCYDVQVMLLGDCYACDELLLSYGFHHHGLGALRRRCQIPQSC